jgi:hypothetical protein
MLLVYNDSPRLANLKRVSALKRKGGKRMETLETLQLILCSFFEMWRKKPAGKENDNTLGKKNQL